MDGDLPLRLSGRKDDDAYPVSDTEVCRECWDRGSVRHLAVTAGQTHGPREVREVPSEFVRKGAGESKTLQGTLEIFILLWNRYGFVRS